MLAGINAATMAAAAAAVVCLLYLHIFHDVVLAAVVCLWLYNASANHGVTSGIAAVLNNHAFVAINVFRHVRPPRLAPLRGHGKK